MNEKQKVDSVIFGTEWSLDLEGLLVVTKGLKSGFYTLSLHYSGNTIELHITTPNDRDRQYKEVITEWQKYRKYKLSL